MDLHYPEILRESLGRERDQGNATNDRTAEEAAYICGRCQSSSITSQINEPINRKERAKFGEIIKPLEEAALSKWARERKLWIDREVFDLQYAQRKIGEGAEQKVFLKEDGLTVIKINSGVYHFTWLDYINRILFHQFIFPSTKYKLIGFTTENNSLAAIVEQPFAILRNGASRLIIEDYFSRLGFFRMKNDDYYNNAQGILLEDLHDENIFEDQHGNISFIDPVIYFETPDMRLGGKKLFHFPFK